MNTTVTWHADSGTTTSEYQLANTMGVFSIFGYRNTMCWWKFYTHASNLTYVRGHDPIDKSKWHELSQRQIYFRHAYESSPSTNLQNVFSFKVLGRPAS